MWEENQKIINIVDEKIFYPRLKIGKNKPKVCVERRDLIKEGLGWNKMLFSS